MKKMAMAMLIMVGGGVAGDGADADGGDDDAGDGDDDDGVCFSLPTI